MEEQEIKIQFKPPNQFTGQWSGMYVELHNNGPYIQCRTCAFMSDLCGHAHLDPPTVGYYIDTIIWRKNGLSH